MSLAGEYEPSPTQWVRDQVAQIEGAGTTDGITIQGRPVVLMTTRGAKTGKLRKTPLMRVEHNGEYAVVASLGGAPQHPVWYHNVTQHPTVTLQDGDRAVDMAAREVTGEEKALWWERAVAAFPSYADYQANTDRQIPVFVLSARELS